LIVWEPGAPPGRVARPVQSPHQFPTILRYLGLPIPAGTQGQQLLEVDHPTVSEVYPHRDTGRGPPRFERILRSIRVGEYRYFRGSTGEERLFHLIADPHETRNLISERPEVAASARRSLDEWLLSTPEVLPPTEAPPKADAEALENLRTLGYVR
jgi:arylsulfatase A-like enzyme